MTKRKIGRALLSVSDKTGIAEFARALHNHGIVLVSTGGTAKLLKEAALPVHDVSDLTGFPEMMDGRVKTLHPGVHGGLLAVRGNEEHEASMAAHDIAPIDLLVVNLYPFVKTVESGADFDSCIENIDIGGPAMIRAAAKNHDGVAVVVEPSDYARILEELDAHEGETTLALRKELAARAFAHTAAYDGAIARWFAGALGDEMPETRSLTGKLAQALRYGENPHQQAGFYRGGEARPGVATAVTVQGKELSYNNLNDTDAAYELVAEFDPDEAAAVAIIKHANPCGVAQGSSLADAYKQALLCDPVSAFGGIIALNQTLDAEAAEEIIKIFTEVIIAPDATDEAKAIIAQKKNLRLLLAGGLPDPRAEGLTFRSLAGGFLVQSRDNQVTAPEGLKVVTKTQPSEDQLADMLFAFTVAKHVKSNAIVFAKDLATVGIGAGQMSRVDAARMASWKGDAAADAAGLEAGLTMESVAASDAFFPFPDGLEAIAAAGAKAVIQPGGSMRDEEVIAAADDFGLAMVFTGMRHFRH
ncbi:bifunctional phosphoribosylaminoimidazolecarboxamide formyltransferase/IMP cyclohydrolase [Methyloligella sp. 2.7D]|nr:bifunctional phosphoribosylaminoimidazolecarboxamide formyltransferase/IMP cyclohydrolase [Methyloligella sp. GL2]QKP76196.1 bifunctional phosphoribosylaminoimidazolecarboxamide formyltransferase/IMP cyclohydrolase [Methyloligella sp. GL2]